jgi:succinoglycan biosynthesis protein ExoA
MAVKFPSVTVMMPVRNEQHHLAEAVASVLSQNYPGELEIILAIAPSVDQTEQVAKELSKKHPLLSLIENPKGLTTVGLNLAIARAKGEVIVRVDAHSKLGENYILRGVEILRETDSVLVGGIMNASWRHSAPKSGCLWLWIKTWTWGRKLSRWRQSPGSRVCLSGYL